MNNSRSITMLMKKVALPNLVYLYYPVHYLIGDYSDEEGIFYEDNDEYLDISSGSYEIYEANYGVMNTTSLDEIKDIYSTDTEEEAIKCYTDEYRNLAYLMSYDVETTNSIVEEIDLESFVEQEYSLDDNTISLQDNKLVQVQLSSGEDMIAINMNSYLDDLKELAQVFKEEQFTNEQKIAVKKEIKEIIDCFQQAELAIDTNKNVVKKKAKKKINNPEEKEIFNIEKIYKELTSTVIAQDEPAERFVVEICRMILSNQRNGILLTGSTGVGKTELIKCLGKAIERPVLIVDSTQITAPAFVGRNIEEFLYDLIVACDGNIATAEKAIVVFDEIDKKGSNKKDDPNGRGVLNTLLKFLDGTVYKASPNQQNLMREPIQIDTSNMIVIGCGAFNDVYKTDKTKSVGFNSNPEEDNVKNPTIDDFCEKAMMPDEFMGRFPIIIKLNDLGIEDLKNILKKSKNNTLKEQRELFKTCGVELRVSEGYLDAIAKKAYDRATGARSLKSEITETTWKPFEEVRRSTNKYSRVELTEDTVQDINNYKLVKRRIKKDK